MKVYHIQSGIVLPYCFRTQVSSSNHYGRYKTSIGRIIWDLCERKGVTIHEANACSDHIHMLVSIASKFSVSSFMGYLKGKSSLMIFDKHANLKYKYGNRSFGVEAIM